MSGLFLKILNMSILASYIVLAVLLLRLLLKKAPKWINCILWGIVGLRLVLPFSIESMFSLIPSTETISKASDSPRPYFESGISVVDNQVNGYLRGTYFEGVSRPQGNFIDITTILGNIWLVGVVALLIYTVISYVKLKKKIGTAVLLRDSIYQSENVVSPFVLGVIKPKIYLPFNMKDKDMEHVVAHEMAHIRRKDHIWKPLGFLLLTLHWFNPLMWLGYVLLCRDIELACDEKVIKELEHDARADYSEALLTCSVNRRMIAACPLAFGEVGVKDRVKSVLNYKKPAFWIIIAAVIACVAVAVCFLTNPLTEEENKEVTPTEELFTEYEGVYISIKSIDTNAGGHTVFNVVWHNETNEEVQFGDPYSIQRKEGDEWVNTSSTELIFLTHARILNPDSTVYKSYSTQRFDISQSGTYRLKVSFDIKKSGVYETYHTWIEFKVGAIPTKDALRELYPEYFGLDASNGLDVYVWQMTMNSYSFGLLPHSELEPDLLIPELMNLVGTSAEEMSVILSTYNVDENEIHIIPWHNPLSSYLADWQIITDDEDPDIKMQEYIENIRQMLSSVIVPMVMKPYYDAATFDIDNDGVDEVCTMGLGPTSGLFTFTFNAREVGTDKIEYHTIIYSQWYDLSFQKGDDGITRVQGITQGENPEIHLFDISIKDGYVYLTENGIPIGEIN